MVDEAQNLPPRTLEELRMLSNFQISDMPLIQSFLLGQQEFRATLRAPQLEQLRQRIIASCHLDPLERDETRAYITHRLNVVGWQSDPEFCDEVFHAIHGFTEGIPRKINLFCDRLLLFGYLEGIHRFDEDTVREVAEELAHESGIADTGAEGSEKGYPEIKPLELGASSDADTLPATPHSDTAPAGPTSQATDASTEDGGKASVEQGKQSK